MCLCKPTRVFQSGFISQLKVSPTKYKYCVPTIFIDNCSDPSYLFLQNILNFDEMVQENKSFEAYRKKLVVKIKDSHAKNGEFQDNTLMPETRDKIQTISFYRVNVHFQNGKADKRIRYLQEKTMKKIQHVKVILTSAARLYLFTYTLRRANHIHNFLPKKQYGTSPTESFIRAPVSPNLIENHSFGCLVYALQDRLQTEGRIPKCNTKSRLVLYLWPCTSHDSLVYLFLNTEIGIVTSREQPNLIDTLDMLLLKDCLLNL